MEIKKENLARYKKWAVMRDIFRVYNKLVSNFKSPDVNYIVIKSQLEKIGKLIDDIKRTLKKIIDKDDENLVLFEKDDIKEIIEMNFLEDLSLNDLKYVCKTSKIKGYSRLNKKGLIEKITKNENLNIPILFKKLKAKAIKLKKLLNELENYFNKVQENLGEWKEKFKINFGKSLKNQIKEMGLNLEGHYPLLKSSFFTFEIDFERPTARIWYGPKQEKIMEVRLDPEEIARRFKEIRDELINRELDGEKFMMTLFEAYKVTCFREKKDLGEQVPIIGVLLDYIFLIQDNKYKARPSKKYYQDYNRMMFSYDLYQLKTRKINNKRLRLIPATRAYTKNQKDFLWVPIKESVDGNYYSHLIFEEVKNH
ncbi:MAG: hypothetical protein ACTSRH_08430 [Promethearchaeota archaeon]